MRNWRIRRTAVVDTVAAVEDPWPFDETVVTIAADEPVETDRTFAVGPQIDLLALAFAVASTVEEPSDFLG